MPWLLLIIPLLAAVANQLYLKRNAFLASIVSVGSVIATFVISLLLFGQIDSETIYSWNWISLTGDQGIDISLKLDQLSIGMMLVVTGIGMMVHIFSLAYMSDDPGKARYFTGLSLFMFSMTGIVLAGNFIMTFIFWELVGLSSYLLIGHWYQKVSAADAAKKAFIVNRVGDFGFMVGILLLFGLTGTFAFDDMQGGLTAFATAHPEIIGGLLGVAILCVFCGAVGKSAQMPLHVWLPDAMEGPTPVSALIHAATMVAAGVYMLARLQLSLGPIAFDSFAWPIVAWVGGITALGAALMATQQDDIKRILAYSTLSQLGYMVMAVGLLAGDAAMFHLFTHAWFKALLFLASGAIIFACHHQQNIWKMGGLLKKMPITGFSFLAGMAALVAVPFTSGFFSKEAILHAAHQHNPSLFWLAVAVAVLTPFYMTRAFVVAFLGKPRSDDANHAKEVGPLMFVPLVLLAVMALISGYTWINGLAPALPHGAGEFHLNFICYVSFAALLVGSGLGFVLYSGRDKDPLSIPLFRERFYIDTFYDKGLVKFLQDGGAALINFFDDFIINGLLVGGSSRLVATFGGFFRRIQNGNLQAYAFALGLGMILIVYFTTFWK